MHDDPNLQLLEAAARALEPLLGEVVFVGGCVTGLMITDPAVAGTRPTTDVDVIAEVYSYAEYGALSDRLLELGLIQDARDGAPTCRWRSGDLTIDVMPIDEGVLGFANRWHRPAMESADRVELSGLTLQLITPVYFVAAKLEAFHGRGGGDHVAESRPGGRDGGCRRKRRATFRSAKRTGGCARLRPGRVWRVTPLRGLPQRNAWTRPADDARLPLLQERLEALASPV